MFVAILIVHGLPISIFAQTYSGDALEQSIIGENELLKIEEKDLALEAAKKVEDDNGFSEGAYTYRAPSQNAPMIESLQGILTIVGGYAIIELENKSIPIPSFDFYKIVSDENELLIN